MQANLINLIPSVESDELAYLQAFTADLTPQQLQTFASVYNGKRKKAETILICCIIGFIAVGGVQRFVLGQIGMGILYLFTGGLCLIGTIVDVINHKKLTFEYNQKMAIESMGMIQAFR
jgi:TM2 domain-containing membrane protein YozV